MLHLAMESLNKPLTSTDQPIEIIVAQNPPVHSWTPSPMRGADAGFGGLQTGLPCGLPFGQHPGQPGQPVDFPGLRGHHIRQVLHRPHQVGDPFLQPLDPVHHTPRLPSRPPRDTRTPIKSEGPTMAEKPRRPRAETPKGFRDYFGTEVTERKAMLDAIAGVYHRYGFDPLETSAVETVEALGKFLPDVDRPNEGVFAWQDEDQDWLALRYDLTAPLARVAAQYRNDLPSPYRRYAMGPVWRNEKPGPGRFRQFYQCDADTVGSASVAADAEICAMLADALETVGIPRGDYVVKVNNRKVLNGVMEVAGLAGDDKHNRTRHRPAGHRQDRPVGAGGGSRPAGRGPQG